MSIFKNQSKIDIILDTEIPVAGSRRMSILFTKPSGLKGEWLAEQDGATTIKYSVVDDTVLNEVGRWKLQSMIIDSEGKVGFGSQVSIDIRPTLIAPK